MSTTVLVRAEDLAHITDLQDVFDHVAKHMLKQGVRSVDNMGNCQYRGVDGLMCAVGCLITDRKYKRKIEGHSVYDTDVWAALPAHVKKISNVQALLNGMQNTHDKSPPNQWALHLAESAKHYGLNTDALPIVALAT